MAKVDFKSYKIADDLTFSGREWLEKKYLSFLSGSILFVGVNTYTKHYPELVKNPELFETVDICPERGKLGGSKYKHHVCDFKSLNPEEYQYDHICLYGIHGFYGHEINTGNLINDILHANKLLKQGGTLMWGPSPELKIQTEDELEIFSKYARDICEIILKEKLKYTILEDGYSHTGVEGKNDAIGFGTPANEFTGKDENHSGFVSAEDIFFLGKITELKMLNPSHPEMKINDIRFYNKFEYLNKERKFTNINYSISNSDDKLKELNTIIRTNSTNLAFFEIENIIWWGKK